MTERLRALIVHADTPIGEAAMVAVKARGMDVISVITDAKTSLKTSHSDKSFWKMDTFDESAIEKFFKDLDQLPQYLILTPALISNQRPELFSKPFKDSSMNEWDEISRSLVRPCVIFCRVFGEAMKMRGSGRIIQIISNSGSDPYYPQEFKNGSEGHASVYASPAFSASAGALMGLAKHLAVQYQDSGVLINNLVCGPIEGVDPAPLIQNYPNRVPLGRAMKVSDVANALDLLLDPQNIYMTGQNIVVDGGVTVW